MRESILQFIKEFKKLNPKEIEKCFMCGNCYHFALILSQIFGGTIYHVEVDNHFITYIINGYYDICGEYDVSNKKIIKFDDLKNQNDSYYNGLLRDCVHKGAFTR